jgi:A/G-specific adenine glycosylase
VSVRRLHEKFRKSVNNTENYEDKKSFHVPGELFFSPEHANHRLVYFCKRLNIHCGGFILKTPAAPAIMDQQLTASSLRRFRKTVYAYYNRHGRRLPWRRDFNPYHIFVSEIMLQQTQVDRVSLKFDPFIKEFPDFAALAGAPLSKVLRLWQGLGYNRRALNLKRAAEIITGDHNGVLPDAPAILETLPGIGKATAASIAAFAFDKPVVFLETNIRTVLIHHFFKDAESVHDEKLLPFAACFLDRKNPRKWYSALMDYGTMLKKQYGNAARRSAGYKKQSRFEGSRRQKRGRILRLLLEQKKPLTAGEISRRLKISLNLSTGILEELIGERIVIKKKNRYLIV